MKTRLFLINLCLLISFLVSCSKDDKITEGELIGQEIGSLVRAENVNVASVYVLKYFSSGP